MFFSLIYQLNIYSLMLNINCCCFTCVLCMSSTYIVLYTSLVLYIYIDNVSHLSTLTSLQTFIYTQITITNWLYKYISQKDIYNNLVYTNLIAKIFKIKMFCKFCQIQNKLVEHSRWLPK